jgi:hypothetical protein
MITLPRLADPALAGGALAPVIGWIDRVGSGAG